ncbi:hypothetical protein ACFYY5_29680 [Nocardia elegans]|uniref:Uncharacterized protein n=1 Tax=Nocardia elegans TaxID=300029 RepID=A0ABW6TP58_9NOCA
MAQLNRVDIIPSADWSVIATSGRLVWAAIINDLIATYWYEADDAPELGGYHLIRTDTLPDAHSVIGPGPILPYWPKVAEIDGAYPFVNSDLFLWVAKVGALPTYAIEGVTPTVTYPLNQNLTPPSV